MVRNLYRAYLYAVCVILLITAATTTSASVALWLARTSLRGIDSSAPDYRQIVQSLVAFVVVWLVTLPLGGLHYWLIRRDMAGDPAAGGGAVRSFFLNMTQMVVVLIAIGAAASGISALGDPYNSPIYGFSTAFSMGGLFALLQVERQRTRATSKGALALQRLHLYGAQLIIVFIVTPVWLHALYSSVIDAYIAAGNYNPCDAYFLGSTCTPSTSFPVAQIVAAWGAALFVAACWVVYTWYSRSDHHSGIRQVTHLLATGYGLSFVLRGAQGIVEAILRAVVRHPFASTYVAQGAGNAVGELVLGTAVLLAYWWLYARESPDLPSGATAARLIELALVAVVLAFPFWMGLRMLVTDVIERVVPAGSHPLAANFAQDGAVLLSGLAFVPAAVMLGVLTRQTDITWPQRVFVLIQLAVGVIASATGLVMALQAILSSLLGAPPDNWQQTARSGGVTLLIGMSIVAIFATLAVRNRYLVGRQEAKPAEMPLASAETQPATRPGYPAEPLDSLEEILDALVVGRITRDEAAARIRSQAVLY